MQVYSTCTHFVSHARVALSCHVCLLPGKRPKATPYPTQQQLAAPDAIEDVPHSSPKGATLRLLSPRSNQIAPLPSASHRDPPQLQWVSPHRFLVNGKSPFAGQLDDGDASSSGTVSRSTSWMSLRDAGRDNGTAHASDGSWSVDVPLLPGELVRLFLTSSSKL